MRWPIVGLTGWISFWSGQFCYYSKVVFFNKEKFSYPKKHKVQVFDELGLHVDSFWLRDWKNTRVMKTPGDHFSHLIWFLVFGFWLLLLKAHCICTCTCLVGFSHWFLTNCSFWILGIAFVNGDLWFLKSILVCSIIWSM